MTVPLSSYEDQLLVQFNVDCGEGTLAFFNITNLNLQTQDDCEDQDGNKRYMAINVIVLLTFLH